MIFTTDEFSEVALESWAELHLNQQPVNPFQRLEQTELSGDQFNSHSEPTL